MILFDSLHCPVAQLLVGETDETRALSTMQVQTVHTCSVACNPVHLALGNTCAKCMCAACIGKVCVCVCV